jgi:hypothetical protein
VCLPVKSGDSLRKRGSGERVAVVVIKVGGAVHPGTSESRVLMNETEDVPTVGARNEH